MPHAKRSSSGSGPNTSLSSLVLSGDNTPRGRPPKLALGTARMNPVLQVNGSDPIVLPNPGGGIPSDLRQTLKKSSFVEIPKFR